MRITSKFAVGAISIIMLVAGVAQPVLARRRWTPPPAPPPVYTARNIGNYITSSPSDPAALGVLDWVAASGMNTVYNYTPFDGSIAQVNAYLDYAQSKGIKVIMSLHNLYTQHPEGAYMVQTYPGYGSTDEQIALNVVRDFQAHPAVWGFSLTDERPESLADLNIWQPVLADRYAKVKALTAKPLMDVLVGWTSPTASDRITLLNALKPSRDSFGLDYYPIPFLPQDRIAAIAGDLVAVGDTNGWFVEQAFSWASYPSVVQGWGFSPTAARYPTTSEMVSMGNMALANGAKNILFYSYFDIAASSTQKAAVAAAVAQIKLANP